MEQHQPQASMGELARPSSGPLEPYEPGRACAYCGAKLHPAFYFCLSCATPYKDPDSVVPRARPMKLTPGMLIARKAPQVSPVFWTYFAVVVGTAVLCWVLFGEGRSHFALFFQSAAIFVTTCMFAVMYWASLKVQFKRLGFSHPAAWMGLACLAPLLVINFYYHGWLVREMGVHRALPLDELRQSGLGEAGLVLFFCVLPAVLEEIAFRGLVQHWLATAVSPMRALVLASALFTVLHFSVVSAPYLFAVGMALGWAKWKTGSLYPSMLMHLVHNYVVIQCF